MPVSWELRGADELIERYGKFELTQVLTPSFERGLARMQSAMARYPAPRTGSRYVRTGTLGRRWTEARPVISPLQGRVVNNTRYGPYVQRDPSQGQPGQARVHQGRWQTDVQVMNQHQGPIVTECEQAIEKALEAGGRG